MSENLKQQPTKVQIPDQYQSINQTQDTIFAFSELIKIVSQLRGPEGCPWDKEQTQLSLTQYAIEEAYELAEAIESGNISDVKEELGDFLFQVILQSQVAEDENKFSLLNVILDLNKKMVTRHPHVFTDLKVNSIAEIWKNWEQIKASEKNKPKPVFSYPKKMPALLAANKIGVKTEGYGFDWANAEQVFEKVLEETGELADALDENNIAEIEHEIGDLMFTAAQLARHCKLDPEQVLRSANRRFEERFNKVLELSQLDKENFKSLSDDKKQDLWDQAKKLCK